MASSATPPAASPDLLLLTCCSHIASTGTSTNGSGNAGESAWFIATFASNHMTGDKSLISNFVPVSNQVVKEGLGQGMQICGKGYVNTETVVLPDVWYVPGLTMNQVSVGQLTEDPDLIVKMRGGGCHISKKSGGSVVGRACLRSDHKFAVDFLKIKLN